jgi:hypothetical protein
MKTRWKILIGIGAFLLLAIAVFLVSFRLQPENEVETYKKLLLAKGEKLEISEVLPPPVQSESNSVGAVKDAFQLFSKKSEKIPDAMKMIAPGKALISWRQLNVRGDGFSNSWVDFTTENSANRPAIELLHQVLDYPKLDFQLDYKKGLSLALTHLSPMKRATQKLSAATICDLHNGNLDAAATNILTMLALVERNEGEGLLISHLVRVAITAMVVVPTWEFLQTTNATEAQLSALQRGWEHLSFFTDAEKTFEMERAWAVEAIQKSRVSHKEFAKTLGTGASSSGAASAWTWPPDWKTLTEKPRYAVAEIMWRSSWSYADELRTLQGEQIILETLRAMQTNQNQCYKTNFDAMKTRFDALGITNVGAAFFRVLNIPDMSEYFGGGGLIGVPRKTIRMEVARRVIVVAIALKQFQVRHGHLPETLNELTPGLLATIPIDPYDGKPLRYHPNADGTYLLYCVGEDGVDDGGDPSLPVGVTTTSFYWQNTHARDWVWPQPATDAEVKFFYEHPPK